MPNLPFSNITVINCLISGNKTRFGRGNVSPTDLIQYNGFSWDFGHLLKWAHAFQRVGEKWPLLDCSHPELQTPQLFSFKRGESKPSYRALCQHNKKACEKGWWAVKSKYFFKKWVTCITPEKCSCRAPQQKNVYYYLSIEKKPQTLNCAGRLANSPVLLLLNGHYLST